MDKFEEYAQDTNSRRTSICRAVSRAAAIKELASFAERMGMEPVLTNHE